MTQGLQLVLLFFALFGYAGAGASLAVARYRRLSDGERDLGMIGVAVMLLLFGALCTLVGVGASGIPAFGGVILSGQLHVHGAAPGTLPYRGGAPPAHRRGASRGDAEIGVEAGSNGVAHLMIPASS